MVPNTHASRAVRNGSGGIGESGVKQDIYL